MWRESKVIRLLSIIHNGIILDLVCGFGGSVGEGVRADFPSIGAENLWHFYLSEAGVRKGDLGLDSPKAHGPRGRLIGPGRV